MRLLALVFTYLLLSIPIYAEGIEDLIDYNNLDHMILLDQMRAGNHDESGVNNYYFRYQLHALAVLKEERKKGFKDRRKITITVGDFANLKLKTLAFWQKSNLDLSMRIEGETIRKLASDAMREFKVSEQEVAILAQVHLFEKNKRFFILGEDTMIGLAQYFIIPESIPHKPLIENSKISITDDLGTHATLATMFDALDPKKKKR